MTFAIKGGCWVGGHIFLHFWDISFGTFPLGKVSQKMLFEVEVAPRKKTVSTLFSLFALFTLFTLFTMFTLFALFKLFTLLTLFTQFMFTLLKQF